MLPGRAPGLEPDYKLFVRFHDFSTLQVLDDKGVDGRLLKTVEVDVSGCIDRLKIVYSQDLAVPVILGSLLMVSRSNPDLGEESTQLSLPSVRPDPSLSLRNWPVSQPQPLCGS